MSIEMPVSLKARAPGASTQDILHRDGRPVPPVYAKTADVDLGDSSSPIAAIVLRRRHSGGAVRLFVQAGVWLQLNKICSDGHVLPGLIIQYAINFWRGIGFYGIKLPYRALCSGG